MSLRGPMVVTALLVAAAIYVTAEGAHELYGGATMTTVVLVLAAFALGMFLLVLTVWLHVALGRRRSLLLEEQLQDAQVENDRLKAVVSTHEHALQLTRKQLEEERLRRKQLGGLDHI